MSKIIEELHKNAEYQANKLKIEKVTATDDFILVEGRVHCRVYFAFYKHFIVCSGDYGEWQFNCTWGTVEDKKPVIYTEIDYLCGKASRDCKTKVFNEDLFMEELNEWWEDIKEDYKDEENFDKLQELVDDFDCDGEYRVISAVDEFITEFNELVDDKLDETYLYENGMCYNIQFLINVYMLQKIKEYFENNGGNNE